MRGNAGYTLFVMLGFMPGIRVFLWLRADVDGRNKSGHDG
jgi:hypothetical protein